MKYGTTKTVAIVLLVLSLAVLALGRWLIGSTDGAFRYAEIAAGALLAAAVAVIGVWGRCPSCGKRLMFGFFKTARCPNCHRDLDPDGRYRPGK